MPTHLYSIRTKLTLSFIAALVIVIALVCLTSYFAGRKLLQDDAFNNLNSIRTIKIGQVEQYLGMLQDQCLSTSESTMLFDAMEALLQGFNLLQASETELAAYKQELEKFYIEEFLPKLNKTAPTPFQLQDYFPLDPQTIIVQSWYLAQNPQPLLKKIEYARAPMDHPYNRAHEQYHSIFKRYAKRVGIADMYLIDLATGHVVYSLAKEIDLGTNLMTGPLKETGLGKSFLEIQKTTDENFVKVIDFQFYSPSYGTPVGFISTPIFKDGKKIGGLVFNFPIDTINQIMTYDKHWSEVGLGKTGETFLIGKDKYMRTLARQYIEDPTTYIKRLREHNYDAATLDKMQVYDTTVLLKKVDLDIIRDILGGKTNTSITTDTFDENVIVSYSPVITDDLNWFIIAKINTQEALEPIATLLWYIAICGLIMILLSIIAACAISYSLTHPSSIDGLHAYQHHIADQTQKIARNDAAISQLIHTLQEKHDSSLAAIKNNNEIHQQDLAYGTQMITLLKMLETTHATVTKYIGEIGTLLATVNASDDAKTKLLQSIQISNSIMPLLMNAENSCKQIEQLVQELHTTQEEKNGIFESLSKELHTESTTVSEIESLLAQNKTALQQIELIHKQYTQETEKADHSTKETLSK